jgi:hypothetical protein
MELDNSSRRDQNRRLETTDLTVSRSARLSYIGFQFARRTQLPLITLFQQNSFKLFYNNYLRQ